MAGYRPLNALQSAEREYGSLSLYCLTYRHDCIVYGLAYGAPNGLTAGVGCGVTAEL